MGYRILIVDDDASARDAVGEVVRPWVAEVEEASTAEHAQLELARHRYDLVIADLVLPGMSGLELARRIRQQPGAPAVVLVTGHASLETAVEAIKAGASDYLTKPVDPAALRAVIDEVLSRLPREPLFGEATGLVADAPAMKKALDRLSLAAANGHPVLLMGEPGTGKKQCARWLHERSPRRAGPFVEIEAGASSGANFALELFGDGDTPGRMARARGGTLLVSEVDALDERCQHGLLQLIEAAALARPAGGSDVRVVASTSRDLSNLVALGSFNEALYYRLGIFPVRLPPLRERREDLPALARRFTGTLGEQYRKPALRLTDGALRAIAANPWHGNLRELRRAIEQAVILCASLEIGPELLPKPPPPEAAAPMLAIPVGTAIKEVERQMIVRTLDANRGNKNRTAKQLGISRRSLYNKLERYQIGLDRPEPLGEPLAAGEN